VEALGALLSTLPALTELNLTANFIGAAGAETLAAALLAQAELGGGGGGGRRRGLETLLLARNGMGCAGV
jgi:hypothetical protein